MIHRGRHLDRLNWLFRTFPVVAILGARQVGKTTLARELGEGWGGPVAHFDLERASDIALLADPELTLGPLQGLIILDEIQRRPELFPVLRVLVDRPGSETKFLVLGSASIGLAIFLILELSHPYTGLIRLSPDGIDRVLEILGKLERQEPAK